MSAPRIVPTVDFALAKAAAGAYGFDIAPAGFAYIVSGGFTVDGRKTDRTAIVCQHYNFYHAPGGAKAAEHLSTSWAVEFTEDAEPLERSILHSLTDALQVAKDFCAGDNL